MKNFKTKQTGCIDGIPMPYKSNPMATNPESRKSGVSPAKGSPKRAKKSGK